MARAGGDLPLEARMAGAMRGIEGAMGDTGGGMHCRDVSISRIGGRMRQIEGWKWGSGGGMRGIAASIGCAGARMHAENSHVGLAMDGGLTSGFARC